MKISKNIKLIAGILLSLLAILLIIFFIKNMTSSKQEESQENKLIVRVDENPSEQSFLVTHSLEILKDDEILGSDKAAIKIFVYEDNSNIFSAELASNLDRLLEENQDKIALIYRPFVEKSNLVARDSALLVECSSQQGKGLNMREFLFDQVKKGELNTNNYLEYGQIINLKESDLISCLSNKNSYDKIERTTKEADELGVIGTPTIFIGEEMIIGARPYDDYINSDGQAVDGLKTLIARKLNK